MAKDYFQMSNPDSFNAFYVQETSGIHSARVKTLPFDLLPNHEVTIKVEYSSLNYKDALSSTGKNHVTRNYPHIPGIDAAGTIVDDKTDSFKPGDPVIVTGYDLGTNTFGGFGEYIRVPKDWVVSLPDDLTTEQAMVFGTAGFTALYGIERLKRELIEPASGPVLVTGATGGVGSLAIFGLAQLGYEIIAATRKKSSHAFLKQLGATEIIDSNDLFNLGTSPLLSRKWMGAIETVGGEVLDSVLRQMNEKGAVACCGNILGKELNTNVYPFILRGVSLLGIDSAICTRPLRDQIWKTISSFNFDLLPDQFYRMVSLQDLAKEIDTILDAKQVGRVVIKHRV